MPGNRIFMSSTQWPLLSISQWASSIGSDHKGKVFVNRTQARQPQGVLVIRAGGEA